MSGPRYALLPAAAVTDTRLAHLTLRVLAVLGSHTNNEGWCCVRLRNLAERIGSDASNVSRAIRQLIDLGYVRKRDRFGANGAQLANLYQVVMDREPTDPDGFDEVGQHSENPDCDHHAPLALCQAPHGSHAKPPLGATPSHSPTEKNDLSFERPSSSKSTRKDAGSDEEPDSSFDRWWRDYPHKVGKGDARRAFRKAAKKTPFGILFAGLRRYVETKPADRPWCNPATWLNGERWLDEPVAAPARPAAPQRRPPTSAANDVVAAAQELLNGGGHG